MKVKYKISPDNITHLLGSIVIVLLVLNFIAGYVVVTVKNETVLEYFTIFYFDAERNLPTTYSALAILFAAFWVWQIANLPNQIIKGNSIYWKIIAFVFIFLAADEYTSIHEQAGHVLRLFTTHAFPHQGWYIPVLILMAGLSLFFIKFFFRLPKRTQINFIIAGLIFVGGAVGVEVLTGLYLHNGQTGLHKAFNLVLLVTLEELMEMVGIILFIKELTYFYVENSKEGMKVKLKLAKDSKKEILTEYHPHQNGQVLKEV